MPAMARPLKNLGRKRLAKKYAESFSIYALSRIFAGSWKERLFWGTVLGGAFSLIGVVFYGFLKDYTSFEVRTDLKIQHVANIDYPSLTICPIQMDIFCHNKISEGNKSCHTRPAFNVKYTNLSQYTQLIEARPNKIYPECITFNPDGNISVPYTGLDISIKFYIYPTESVNMTYLVGMHDFDGSRVALHEMTAGRYEFQLRERMDIHRLGKPYPSNCTAGKHLNMFPGRYTQEKCKDTCLVKLLLKRCGHVPDMFKSFMTEEDMKLVRKVDGIRNCWRETYIYFYAGDGHNHCECPLSCNDVSYDYVFLTQEKWHAKNSTEIHLICTSLKKVHLIELPAYPITKFMSDIGGWLGLLVGMSALSVVEIIAYLALKMSVFLPGK